MKKLKNFENIAYKLRPNLTSLARAKASLTSKPLNIIMLTLDSLSRRMAFRRLPRTIDILNTLNTNHSIYDFKLHQVMGQDSLHFFIPMILNQFSGQNSYNLSKSVWQDMHRNGFVSLLGTDICGMSFSNVFGRIPDVDHIMSTI